MNREMVLKEAKELLEQVTWRVGPPPKDYKGYECKTTSGSNLVLSYSFLDACFVGESGGFRGDDIQLHRPIVIDENGVGAVALRNLIEHYEAEDNPIASIEFQAGTFTLPDPHEWRHTLELDRHIVVGCGNRDYSGLLVKVTDTCLVVRISDINLTTIPLCSVSTATQDAVSE